MFNKTGLGYFSYRKYFDDGNALFLSTCPEREKYYVEKKIFPTFSEYQAQKQIGSRFIFMSEDMPLPKGMSKKNAEKYLVNVINATAYKIHHRLVCFTSHVGYTRLCSFGVNHNSKSIFESYLNLTHYLENFILEFEEKAKRLIEQGSENRIALPGYCDVNEAGNSRSGTISRINPADPWLKLLSTEITLGRSNRAIHLTRRELECLLLQQLGNSAKETANILFVSDRTVESHIKNAKNKIGFIAKDELQQALWGNAYCRAFLTKFNAINQSKRL
jgi:DNA-binding CsgD family transcriptional regulator